jgi:histone-arginine methyltransferase CARM1
MIEKVNQEDSDRDPTYFQYYAQLVHQQNMLQDNVRTSIYYGAITGNPLDFVQKSVIGN